jgi:hypothetical protein
MHMITAACLQDYKEVGDSMIITGSLVSSAVSGSSDNGESVILGGGKDEEETGESTRPGEFICFGESDVGEATSPGSSTTPGESVGESNIS